MNLAPLALTAALTIPSGITLHEFAGFETGGTEEIGTSLNILVTTSPVPHSSKEVYVCEFGFDLVVDRGSPMPSGAYGYSLATTRTRMAPGNSYVRSDFFTIAEGDYVTVGGWFRFDSIGVSTNMGFLEVGDPGTSLDIFLRIKTADGDLELYDSNGSLVDTYSDAFVEDTWYLIELKYEMHNSTAEADVYLDENKVISVSSQDFRGPSAATARRLGLRGRAISPIGSGDIDLWVDNYYIYYDDGAAIDTNDTILGEFTVLGPYEHDNTGQTADFGDATNSGNWDDAQEAPHNDANNIRYTNTGGTEGGCTTTDTTNGGPKDDSRALGTIKGASWIWRARNQGFSGNQNLIGLYGASNSESTDNTVDSSTFTLSGTYQNFLVFVDDSDSNCPLKTEWMQVGMKKTHSGPTNKDLRVGEMYCHVLHQEERRIIQDGHVRFKER